jgi:hypothetical protein
MECPSLKKDGTCHLNKKDCTIPEDKVTSCNFYIRQHPTDPKVFDNKFNKALSKALKKRDFYKEIDMIKGMYKLDYSKSIFDNVQGCLKGLKKPSMKVKERRSVGTGDIKGNILRNITSNLYEETHVEILEKQDNNNSLLVEKEGVRYRYTMKDPIDEIIKRVTGPKADAKYFQSQIVETVKLG